ncbi:hypothetical protein GOODEAATRI_020456 [Goodea atripinnis]|uniref:Fibronectin type-III domain-containing protein n=1 Tax=Goodea atripinnis TaxID=208336 RepID=A0ABV0MWS7_9TELE
MRNFFHFFYFEASFNAAFFSYFSFLSGPVCSSAPVSMKIQPLNETALMVSWERPLTIYHPPITSYMVSYSWVKRDVADEKTFIKTGDQSMGETGCDELCMWLLLDMRTQTLPLSLTCLTIEAWASRRRSRVTTDICIMS